MFRRLSKKTKNLLPKSAPGTQLNSPTALSSAGSETSGGRAYSTQGPGANHPEALSTTSGGSLSFLGSPTDFDRPLQEGEELVELDPLPWDEDVEDSRERYPPPLFPAPISMHTGQVEWTNNEKTDFIESVKYWRYPGVHEGGDKDYVENRAEEMWGDRCRKNVARWLTWSAARGAFLLEEKPSIVDLEPFSDEPAPDETEYQQGPTIYLRSNGEQIQIPPTAAFMIAESRRDVGGSTSSSGVSLIIGGGI